MDQLAAVVGLKVAVTGPTVFPEAGVPVTKNALLPVVSVTPPPLATGPVRPRFSKLRSMAPQPLPTEDGTYAAVLNAFPVAAVAQAAIAPQALPLANNTPIDTTSHKRFMLVFAELRVPA